jgi:hypothetical protein
MIWGPQAFSHLEILQLVVFDKYYKVQMIVLFPTIEEVFV